MRSPITHALSKSLAPLLASVLAVAGCSLSTDAPQPVAIEIVQGDMQTAGTNTPLDTSLSVIVVTQFGGPVSGAAVQWSVISGGGSVDPVLSQTTDRGIAMTSYTTGATAGTATIQAKALGLPPVTFTITVT
jgi:NADH:ubiquinone oxidoreductase subunit F (NADH-binding)